MLIERKITIYAYKFKKIIYSIDFLELIEYNLLKGGILMKREILEDLIKWKESKNRKPLIVHGARQVGKTYIIKEFGKKYYKNLIYVNFQTNTKISSQIEDSIDAKYIINKLELFYGEKIIPEETLIFFFFF